MSADLELRQGSPRIQVPSTKVETLQSCSGSDDVEIRRENGNRDSDCDDGCRTPTSEEHKIPAVLSCPPAPRKPRRMPSCKRKLSEFDFFQIVKSQEVESLFRSSFDSVAPKRRCMPL
ncbi:hypothetical protein JCGZ_01562 [Jatropha curcas]|uniref:Cyclin-dependent protein kinase inhibitor SMR1 n=1 Tax=Jatropha curcas TaxID=180498 RepID=A0A067L9G3_JATCU|nr:cyclin-dependent protein kinase inhibitor SMR1 [Jatropha curcas]KDP45062.1 hypothetical protein JCGZ_01562 [Jatropha curcas]